MIIIELMPMMQSQLPRGVAFIFLLFKTKMSENIWLLFFYLNLFKNKKKLNDNRNYNILKVLAHSNHIGWRILFCGLSGERVP